MFAQNALSVRKGNKSSIQLPGSLRGAQVRAPGLVLLNTAGFHG